MTDAFDDPGTSQLRSRGSNDPVRRLLQIIVLVGGIFWAVVIGAMIWSPEDQIGASPTPTNSPIRGLPPNATDIRWFLPRPLGPVTAYNFVVSEAEFLAWAAAIDSPLNGPKEGPTYVTSYTPANDFWESLLVMRAIKFSWRDGDRGVSLVYDRDTGIAYYYRVSR